MTSSTEMTNIEWTIEATARAMYVSRKWKEAISEPDHQIKDQTHYEAVVGGYWDSGRAGFSMYQEFRKLAAVAVTAATPGILAAAADKVETARIDAGPVGTTDRLKPLLRVNDFAAWLRREASAPARAAFLKSGDSQ